MLLVDKVILLLVVLCFSNAYAFKLLSPTRPLLITRHTRHYMHSSNNNINNNDDIVIEVVTTKTATQEEAALVAYDAVYSDEKEDKVSIVLDSPVSKVLDLVFNPFALVLTLYFVILGYNKMDDFIGRIMTILGRKPKDETPSVSVEDMPYQVFECEVCQMQMRPAKGRAEKIFGRKNFRCSRCGAKASSYFNIDDMEDSRAVARLERLKREEEDNDYMIDDDDDYGDDE